MYYHGSIYSSKFLPLDLQIVSSCLRVRLGEMKIIQTKFWSEWLLKKKIIMLCEMYPFFNIEQSIQALAKDTICRELLGLMSGNSKNCLSFHQESWSWHICSLKSRNCDSCMTSKHFLHQTYIFASPPIPISSNILALEDHRQNSCFQLRLSSFLPLEWHHLPHFMKIRKAQQSRACSCRDRAHALTKLHVWGEAKKWRNTLSGGLEAHISSRYLKSLWELKKHSCNTVLEENAAFTPKWAGSSGCQGREIQGQRCSSCSWVFLELMSRWQIVF